MHETTVLSCHRCLINTGVEKNEQHLNIDYNFDHQMSQVRVNFGIQTIVLQFLKRVVPLIRSVGAHFAMIRSNHSFFNGKCLIQM